MQFWIYEGSNIIELRYGTSQVSGNKKYFRRDQNFGPTVGILQEVDSSANGRLYTLVGNPASPTIDSIDLNGFTGNSLNRIPPIGTVYRFTPKLAQGVSILPGLKKVAVYPTIATSILNVKNDEQGSAGYTISSIDGQLTGLSGHLNEGLNVIEVGSLPVGTYLLKVQNAKAEGSWLFTRE